MKIINVREINGKQRLAADIFSSSTGNILIAKGTVLKKEYTDRLIALGIEMVKIEDGIDFDSPEGRQIKKEVKTDTKKTVKKLLEQHVYKHSSDLIELCDVAEKIIEDIISEDKVIENIANIRQESNDMYGHSVNVCSLSTLIAIRMKMPKKVINHIAKGSILHDIGLRYITVPYENVQVNRLDELQQEEYKKHVIYGYEAVKHEIWISELSKNIILYHHEYLDGSGYPFGLKDSAINDAIKIVNLCDNFDRMLTGIGYSKSELHEVAEFIRINRGKLLEKEMSDILLSMVAMYPIGTKVRTNENEIGVVISQNEDFTNRPVLRIISDKNGNNLQCPYTKDLLKSLNIFIVDTV